MAEKNITLLKKNAIKGEDGHKVVSVRMPGPLVDKLDSLSYESNRSRNEVINILLEEAIKITKVDA